MANHGGDMFIKALQDRFTCKRYAPEGHISDSDFNTILEAARLSPARWHGGPGSGRWSRIKDCSSSCSTAPGALRKTPTAR